VAATADDVVRPAAAAPADRESGRDTGSNGTASGVRELMRGSLLKSVPSGVLYGLPGHAAAGPRPRLVPPTSGADRNLRRFFEDVPGQCGTEYPTDRLRDPLLHTERDCRKSIYNMITGSSGPERTGTSAGSSRGTRWCCLCCCYWNACTLKSLSMASAPVVNTGRSSRL
jgi:hypothetical protein